MVQLSKRLATDDIHFNIFNVGNRNFSTARNIHLVFYTVVSLIPNNHRLVSLMRQVLLNSKEKLSPKGRLFQKRRTNPSNSDNDDEYDSEAEVYEELIKSTKPKHVEIYRFPIRRDKRQETRKNPKRWDFKEVIEKLDNSIAKSLESKFADRYFGSVRLMDQK